jgi:CDP-glycerol glycerophosphotransferase
MTLISVVIPVFNVAPYVEEALASVAAQTHRELDVVVVDNGSTDGSDAIVQRFVDQDVRFRLLRESGRGPGRARNAGMAVTHGELLTFADGDDLVPPDAYERLWATLQETGSDFITGGFRRLNDIGIRPAYYMGDAFAKRRLRTHIREHRALVRDRTLWNKLFRREFIDKHQLRLGEEGVDGYEDQQLTLAAYFLATSVDVLSEPVYYWRIRESGGLSLSQLRQTPEAICRRLTAIHGTSRFLAEHFPGDKDWYEQSVVVQDLAPLPEVVAAADGTARTMVLDRVGGWLDQTGPAVLDELPAVRRVAWTLVRQRAVDELAELLRFEREDLPRQAPLRRRGHWYGDYPFRRDPRLGLPRELFRVDDELTASVRLAAVHVTGQAVTIEGFANVGALPTDDRDAQSVECVATAKDRQPAPFAVEAEARPDLAALDQTASGVWGGYRATLDLSTLTGGDGEWEVATTVRRRAATRTTRSHAIVALHVVRPAPTPLADGRQVRVELAGAGRLRIHVEPRPPVVAGLEVADGTLRLTGSLSVRADEASLRVRRGGGERVRVDVVLTEDQAGSRFVATLPLDDIARDFTDPLGP